MKRHNIFNWIIILSLLLPLGSMPARANLQNDVMLSSQQLNIVNASVDTGFISPTNFSNDDGNWLNGQNAYQDDGTYAASYFKNNQAGRWLGYGFGIPNGMNITGVEVRLDASVAVGVGWMTVEVFNGSTWSSAKKIPCCIGDNNPLTKTKTTYLLGGSGDTWGLNWSPASIDNIQVRVRVINLNDNHYLWWVPVKIYYEQPLYSISGKVTDSLGNPLGGVQIEASPITHSILLAEPASVPADGVTKSSITLAGAIAGHEVRLVSSRGVVDKFSSISGVVNSNGFFYSDLTSSKAGTTVISVQDLTTGQSLAAFTQVIFSGGATLPSNPGEVVITGVKSQHPLEGRYLQQIPVINKVDVVVDWGNTPPGTVDFVLNGQVFSILAKSSIVSHTLDMGSDLDDIQNNLSIVARSADGKSSKSKEFSIQTIPAPLWLAGLHQAGLLALPILSSGDTSGKASYKMGFHLPVDPLQIDAYNYGVGDADTKLKWSVDGELSLPLDCSSPLKATLTGEAGNFQLFGTKIDIQGYGGIGAERTEICAFELPQGLVGGSIDFKRNLYRKPILVMVTYFNAAIGATVDQIVMFLHVEEYIGKLGEFYLDGKGHIDLESKVAFLDESPFFRFQDLEFSGGLGIEGGFRADIGIAEVKAWAGADGSIQFIRMGVIDLPPVDNWEFDKITLKGEVGFKFRAFAFYREETGSIEWVYPSSSRDTLTLDNLDVQQWTFIPHTSSGAGAQFLTDRSTSQAFARTSQSSKLPNSELAASAVVTSTLVSNVYPYAEPDLALNPADQALLLWVQDDPNKPVGQAQEIQFSKWNGSAWSNPLGITDDTYLDGAPQVAWYSGGEGVAVWERLSETLPITATWNITTAQKIEIATATFSPQSNGWSPASLLTNNAALDLKPVLSSNSSNSLLAVWRQNATGHLSGDKENPDSIQAAFYNAAWSEPVTAIDDIPGLVDLAAGYGNGAATIVFTQYVTPTGFITPALQLFSTAWNGSGWSMPDQLTDDSLGHRNPQVEYTLANEPLVIWQAGGQLRIWNLETNAQATLSLPAAIGGIDQFEIVQTGNGDLAAVFTAQSSQRDLYLAYYDQTLDIWGTPRQITSDQKSESYPAPAIDTLGRLLMAYTTTEMTSVTRSTMITSTGEVITYTIPVEGQTDLVTLAHEFERNISTGTDGLAASNLYPMPGDTVILSATLANTGDMPLSGVVVEFYDGQPGAGGVLLGSREVQSPLPAGITTTLSLPYEVPTDPGLRTYYAVIDPQDQIQERSEADNIAQLQAFGPDLELVDAAVDYWGGTLAGVQTLLVNIGPSTALTTTLQVFRDTITGTLLLTDTIPLLSAGETITLTTAWDFAAFAQGSYPLVIAVNQANFLELRMDNNFAQTTLDALPDLMVTPYDLWSTPLTDPSVTITATLYNNGSQTANNIEVGFYRSWTLTEDDLLFTKAVPGLAPGGTVELTGNTPGPLECGVYIQVDPQLVISETTRANNLAAILGPNRTCAEHSIFLPIVTRNFDGTHADLVLHPQEGSGIDFSVSFSAQTNPDGTYIIPDLPPGSYLVKASQSSQTFLPTSRLVTLPPDATGINFTSQSGGPILEDMVFVPAGEFQMGCDPAHNNGLPCSSEDELPLHTVNLANYYIDKFEVTNGQYAECVGIGSCSAPFYVFSNVRDPYYGNPTYDDYPVIWVNWHQANTYCAWAGKRLPTEAEWEKAARGTTVRTYPWGDEIPTCSLANGGVYFYCEGGLGDTSKVGSYPAGASPYGAMDMAGNVWEWVSSLYAPYPYDATDGREVWNESGNRVMRGGSWRDAYGNLTTARRISYTPWTPQDIAGGFRCAKSP